MSVSITPKGVGVSVEAVRELEAALGRALPDDYRSFLMRNNVAVPDRNVVRVGLISASVEKFFGVSEEADDDLLSERDTYDGRVPASMLPIAEAGGGDLILLELATGAIFLWDHENEAAEGEEAGMRNVHSLAGSFSELLGRLEPFEEPALDPNDVVSVRIRPGFHEKFKKYM